MNRVKALARWYYTNTDTMMGMAAVVTLTTGYHAVKHASQYDDPEMNVAHSCVYLAKELPINLFIVGAMYVAAPLWVPVAATSIGVSKYQQHLKSK